MQFKFRVVKIYKTLISQVHILQDVLDISVSGGIHYISEFQSSFCDTSS